MIEYKCVFKMHDSNGINTTNHSTLIPSTVVAQEGFWVNHSLRFCDRADRVYWIPPGQVLIVHEVATGASILKKRKSKKEFMNAINSTAESNTEDNDKLDNATLGRLLADASVRNMTPREFAASIRQVIVEHDIKTTTEFLEKFANKQKPTENKI